MMEKFRQLQQREQVITVLAAIFILVSMYYLLVWQAVYENQNRHRQLYADAISTRNAVSSYAEQIQVLQDTASSVDNELIENLSSHVNQSLQDRQLTLTQIQQISADQVQLRLENVDFATALAWIHDLESTPGLVLGELSIRPADITQTGQVNLTVGLGLLN